MNLPQRVWRIVEQTKQELELALDLGLGEGKSAAGMSRDVRQYLINPDKLFRRVRDKHGALHLSKKAEAYHPGRGVYRSSYKNALRMTATETNMAYHTADYEAWKGMPLVKGIRIELSNNHTVLNAKGQRVPFFDMCDELQGVYPKDFKFTGWHPFCRCFAVPITASWDEIEAMWEAENRGEDISDYHFADEVHSMPDSFKSWIKKNDERIKRAKNMPYFIKDNYKDGDVSKGFRWETRSRARTSAGRTVANPELSEMQKLSKAIGVDLGAPMAHEQADMKHPNPHYSEAEEYRVNCQSAVVAYELRRRGLPVEAYGRLAGSMGSKLAHNTRAAWLDAEGNIPEPIVCKQEVKKRTVDRRGAVRTTYTKVDEVWRDFMSKTNSEGRYHLSWLWEGRDVGHIITMETFADGTRLFYDPQTGLESKNILPWIMRRNKVTFDLKKGVKAYRVDNLRPNSLVVKGVVKKAGSTGVTPMMTAEQEAWWAKKIEKKTSDIDNINSVSGSAFIPCNILPKFVPLHHNFKIKRL